MIDVIETTSTWRRLSPRMLVIHPFQEVVRAAPALLGLLVAGSSSGGKGHLWSVAGVALMVVLGMLRWFTTTYRITPEHVQVRRGLLTRKVVTVPRDRVRTVDVTSHVLHRVLGLARVEVGTGTSERRHEGRLKLDALTAAEAARLRVELLHRSPAAAVAATASPTASPTAAPVAPPAGSTPAAETELARMRPEWVRFGPFTMSGLVTVGVVAGFVSRLVSEGNVDLGRVGPVQETLRWFTAMSLPLEIATVVLVLVVFVSVASTLGYVLAFGNFRLTRHAEGTLHVTRGLLTTRATTIEERRLRGVEVSEPLLLRAVRGARLSAVTTGLRSAQGSQRGGSMLLPPAPRADAVSVARLVLPRASAIPEASPVTAGLTTHGPAALRRRFTRAYGVHALVLAALLALWWWAGLPSWTWLTTAALLPLTALLAADRYRSLGHALTSGYLVTRWGSLARRRVALECDGVIGWNIERSFFQRRARLATLTATTAAGKQGYQVRDVDLAEALRLAAAGTPGLLDPFLVEAQHVS
ncbi:PH domain-containing protein [Microbispora sp. KK1-11]|uniref:PH domain-containing protein n=1 Tax=Microbispora sp. KK1-11 TaxID=2053005 RepID=UPI00115B91C4|nr:PH domain-containing protein [Microbispora sp. KK1-11]TQS25813.1 PH domain-containing protein [Microbispora sp. KK1-11]